MWPWIGLHELTIAFNDNAWGKQWSDLNHKCFVYPTHKEKNACDTDTDWPRKASSWYDHFL